MFVQIMHFPLRGSTLSAAIGYSDKNCTHLDVIYILEDIGNNNAEKFFNCITRLKKPFKCSVWDENFEKCL